MDLTIALLNEFQSAHESQNACQVVLHTVERVFCRRVTGRAKLRVTVESLFCRAGCRHHAGMVWVVAIHVKRLRTST
eukprot:scaffold1171_cov177-Amphora_coffeaeformis.AAC.12